MISRFLAISRVSAPDSHPNRADSRGTAGAAADVLLGWCCVEGLDRVGTISVMGLRVRGSRLVRSRRVPAVVGPVAGWVRRRRSEVLVVVSCPLSGRLSVAAWVGVAVMVVAVAAAVWFPAPVAAQGDRGAFDDDDGAYYEAALDVLAHRGVLAGWVRTTRSCMSR